MQRMKSVMEDSHFWLVKKSTGSKPGWNWKPDSPNGKNTVVSVFVSLKPPSIEHTEPFSRKYQMCFHERGCASRIINFLALHLIFVLTSVASLYL